MKKGDSKKYLIALVFLAVLGLVFFSLFCCNESGISRGFSKSSVSPGEKIIVSLDINLRDEQTYYLFEESVPEGFVVLEDSAKENVIRFVKIQDAKSNVFTYEIEAPKEVGSYVFSGKYGMEGINGTLDISGENTITVQ